MLRKLQNIGLALAVVSSLVSANVAVAQDTSPNCDEVIQIPNGGKNRFTFEFNCNDLVPTPINWWDAYRTVHFGDGSKVDVIFTTDGHASVAHDYSFGEGVETTYTLGLDYIQGNQVIEDTFLVKIDDRATATPTPTSSVTPTGTPSVTLTPTEIPSVTSTPVPTGTPIPTGTVVPTSTVAPTSTVEPTATVVITPIFTIEGEVPDCRQFGSIQLQPGQSCFIPEGIKVSTSSDVYVSSDRLIYETELQRGGDISGPVWVYAPWGASFKDLTPATPTPAPTATPVAPKFQVQNFMPSIEAPVPGPKVIFTLVGEPLKCVDFQANVAPSGTVCKSDVILKTNSDIYLSWDGSFTEDELKTGGNIKVPAGMYAYLPFGASFSRN